MNMAIRFLFTAVIACAVAHTLVAGIEDGDLPQKTMTCPKCKKLVSALGGLKAENCKKKCRKISAQFVNSCNNSCCAKLCNLTHVPDKQACKKIGYCSDLIEFGDGEKTGVQEVGPSRFEACAGNHVKVVWQGTHNIQETVEGKCASDTIGAPLTEVHNAGYEKTFKNDELSAAPGHARYFQSSSECGENANRIEVSCPPVVAHFGTPFLSRIEACRGDVVTVVWRGTHNLQETLKRACDSKEIGAPISKYHNAGHEETFREDELSAAPGETRYFKSARKCGDRANRIEVSCPALEE
eukprot:CAMPEP_0194308260 /NCGR_PEP_ID=MMETSP0171-20130528/5227_1 /TAXON_ID=218684 /ORGANISM="Corethron pennatum, Strain L29A3" /LENGTH=296 /DNA_ID=CAMNT_0039060805 /DNA_START=117 /DNA_END=1007 /DNA_ORIENTATION=+